MRLKPDLGARTRTIARQHRKQLRGGVADLANVDIVEFRIKLGARRDRGTAQHGWLSGRVGAAADVDDPGALDMHAADEHRVGPGKVLRLCRVYVFVDEPDLPAGRHRRRDDQQALRRHEGTQIAGNVIGIVERTQGWFIAGKDAQNASHRGLFGQRFQRPFGWIADGERQVGHGLL